ncbi:MAG: hypothetical protein ABWX84_15345 [Nocardioides sp.]
MVVVAGMTAGCGAPDDASTKDFCDAIAGLGEAGDDFDKNKDAFKELGDTGTPEGISDDGREGFEILVDLADEAKSSKDAEKSGDDLSSDDEKKVEAFGKYVGETCKA